MDLATVKQIMESSLSRLVEKDSELIDRRVKEECINHRLAIYIDENYRQFCGQRNHCNVDLEYNKNLDREKEVYDGNGKPIRIRPDILLHKRGSNDNNLIAIETKKDCFKRHDMDKIQALLKPPFRYLYGFIILYRPLKPEMKVRFFNRKFAEDYQTFRFTKIQRRFLDWNI
ncbi:MAG TPA: hypothetical protein VIM29_00055 [Bacillota bacterium]